jgi:hypothetical protein
MGPEIQLKNHIRRLEEYLLKPEVRSSPDKLDELLADDFVEFGASGRIYDKQQVITGLLRENNRRLALSDFTAKSLGNQVILATYRLVDAMDGLGEPTCSLRSSLWRLADGRWQVVFHQGTLLGNNGNGGKDN